MATRKFGRYEILTELGRGGMATVYHAHDPRFRRDVALKVLPGEFLHDPTFRARFEREAQTIAALEHTAIVPVYDFGEEEGQPYLVMRHMAGGSLADQLEEKLFSVAEAAAILERICSALDEAHDRNIIHRDLKPGNILLDHRGDPFLSDFGIIKLTEATATLTGSAIIGTPAYMSPEQVEGEANIDRRSDIYSLGTILFEMLTGKLPYEASTPMGMAYKHVNEPVPRILTERPDLPAGCETVIARAMAKDRDERFATAGEMAMALLAVARGERLPAPNPRATARATAIKPSEPEPQTTILEADAITPDSAPSAAVQETAVEPLQPQAAPQAAAVPTTVPERRRKLPVWGWVLGGLMLLLICAVLSIGSVGLWGTLSGNNAITIPTSARNHLAGTALATPTEKPTIPSSPTTPPAATHTPTPSPPSAYRITVTFLQIQVHDDADPFASGELYFDYRVNDLLGDWPAGNRWIAAESGSTLDVNLGVEVTLAPDETLEVYMTGTDSEAADGFSTFDPDDPLGIVQATHDLSSDFGAGQHSVRSTCPDGCYTLVYEIAVEPVD